MVSAVFVYCVNQLTPIVSTLFIAWTGRNVGDGVP